MLTIKQHLESLPEPYKSEALKGSFPSRLNNPAANLYIAIYDGIGDVVVRNCLLLKWDNGDFNTKPEPRPEMVMPKLTTSMWEVQLDNDYSNTESDKFTEQFQGFKDGTINHSEYLN